MIILLIGFYFIGTIQSQKLTCDENSLKFQPTNCVVFNFTYRTNDATDYSSIRRSVTSIEFNNCDVETIPSNLFTSNPNFELVGIQRSKLKSLKNGDFQGASKVKTVGLSGNSLTVIRDSIFEGCSVLETLIISDELNLKTLEVGAFNGLKKLLQLTIKNGIIESIESGIFSDLESLNTLELSGQKLTTLPTDLFKTNKQLHTITLTSNQLSNIPPSTINGIKNLRLNVANNLLKNIRITENTNEVDASSNNITKIICDKTVIITKLNLARNRVQALQCITKMSAVESLDISNNKFTGISRTRFSKLLQLKYLKIDGNNLKNPRPKLFTKNRNLISLQIDKLLNYRPLKKLLPNLLEIVLSTKTWECSQTQQVASILRQQNISMEMVDEFTNFNSFKCKISSAQLNNPLR